MFKHFWGSQEQQDQPRPQEPSTNSWYPPSVSSLNSSRPTTPSASTSSSFSLQPADRASSLSNVSPAEAAGIIAVLKDKNVDELRKLLSDKDAYNDFLLSLEPVKTQNRCIIELMINKNKDQFLEENLEKEPCVMELRNQCRIIRTTELSSAQEKLHELERKNEETLKNYSPLSLLHKLQDATSEREEESEALHRQLLDREIDLAVFLQKYKKLRYSYHKRALTHLAVKTSLSA